MSELENRPRKRRSATRNAALAVLPPAPPDALGPPVDARVDFAHRLRMSGLPWAQVAHQAGYKTAEIAQMAVDVYLQKAALALVPEQRRAALTLELDRLDAMQSLLWPRLLELDYRAYGLILQIMDRRARLLGLNEHVLTASRSDTIVISSGDDMGEHLMEIALAQELGHSARAGASAPSTAGDLTELIV